MRLIWDKNSFDAAGFLQKTFTGCFEKNFYVKKAVEIVISVLPNRIREEEVARRLNISADWLQEIFKESFNITFSKIMQTLRVYYATNLLYEKDSAGQELLICFKIIADELNYSELSSMDRDFKKVLNISPKNARIKLRDMNPDQLFNLYYQYKKNAA